MREEPWKTAMTEDRSKPAQDKRIVSIPFSFQSGFWVNELYQNHFFSLGFGGMNCIIGLGSRLAGNTLPLLIIGVT